MKRKYNNDEKFVTSSIRLSSLKNMATSASLYSEVNFADCGVHFGSCNKQHLRPPIPHGYHYCRTTDLASPPAKKVHTIWDFQTLLLSIISIDVRSIIHSRVNFSRALGRSPAFVLAPGTSPPKIAVLPVSITLFITGTGVVSNSPHRVQRDLTIPSLSGELS